MSHRYSDPSTPSSIPSALRVRVMARAWEIFRETYAYPAVPFRSIGRACFASALRSAWAELREIVRLAAFGVEALKRSIAFASEPRHRVGLSTSYGETAAESAERRRCLGLYTAALNLAVLP